MPAKGRWAVSVLLVGLAVGLLAVVLLPRFAARPPALATPTIVLTVLPLPTATPTATPLPTSTPTPTVTPTPEAASGFAVGRFVQVVDTGGVGLRLRAEPGLTGRVLFLALDSEVFRIADGPVTADGYVWWYLVAPYDDSRAGWAAQEFLQPIAEPESFQRSQCHARVIATRP